MNKSITEHFKWSEPFACTHCGLIKVNDLFWDHMVLLEDLRRDYGRAIGVNCGYRCPEHNEEVGGAPRSMHLEFATDIRCADLDQLYELAVDLGFAGIGRYNTFLHLDLRDKMTHQPAQWDNRS